MTNSEKFKQIIKEKVKQQTYQDYATEVNIFVQEYNNFWKAVKDTVVNTFFK